MKNNKRLRGTQQFKICFFYYYHFSGVCKEEWGSSVEVLNEVGVFDEHSSNGALGAFQ